MTKTFCDRCGVETTDLDSSAILGIPFADEDATGDIERTAEVCRPCYKAFEAWVVAGIGRTPRTPKKGAKR